MRSSRWKPLKIGKLSPAWSCQGCRWKSNRLLERMREMSALVSGANCVLHEPTVGPGKPGTRDMCDSTNTAGSMHEGGGGTFCCCASYARMVLLLRYGM